MRLSACLLCFLSLLLPAQLSGQDRTVRNSAVEASFSPSGAYSITDVATHWTLHGELPQAAEVEITSGSDALGKYQQINASYDNHARTAEIRLYRNRSSVLMLDVHRNEATNSSPFPQFASLPPGLHRLSYSVKAFAKFEFGKLASQGPWLLFDQRRNTMVLSPADNFLVSDLEEAPDGKVTSGIDSQIATLPAGFTHGTLLTFGHGINSTFNAWGAALQKLNRKPAVPNDADVVLEKFGYWTDNGASYYYKFDPSLGYEGTLLAVRDQYKKMGVPIAYLQLDSWWYPKTRGNTLKGGTGDNGAIVYRADPTIFPDGLNAFHKRLGLPMATHARWFSEASPYRREYKMSNNVVIDPRYWNATASYLSDAGVVVYEQDWLDKNARPAVNIAQSKEFLSEMAGVMAARKIGIQYCMALPGYFLASTQFPNLSTIRVSDDRFERARYDEFLYGSALAHAVGLWPWADVFMSDELPNLVLATLSAGPVGVGDALGHIDAANLKRVMRADSVILKPDTPIRPIDATYLADASDARSPMVALTRTDFGPASEYYLIAYPRSGSASSTTVSLDDLGIHGAVYAWNWQDQSGKTIPAGGSITVPFTSGWGYEVLAPINKNGIALLGDTSKIVPLARKRFASVTNNGAVNAVFSFAAGESFVRVSGYSRHKPKIRAQQGTVHNIHYDAATGVFSFSASLESGAHSARVWIQ
jgi:hypothetical protein